MCEDDLATLCARLARPGAPRGWSLCLSGRPGTGKSTFAHDLAGRLGLPLLQKRASNLLSMWVGGSEKAIAAAFAEALTKGALLLFDRGAASCAFEVSQMDEMLTWMERQPLLTIGQFMAARACMRRCAPRAAGLARTASPA